MPTPLFLPHIQAISIPALTVPFVTMHYFKKHISAASPMKIYYIGDNFKMWFRGHTVFDRRGYVVMSHILMRESCDAGIRAVIGNREETDIAAVWYLMSGEPNSGNNIFFTKNNPTIFYCRDAGNSLRAVNIIGDEDGVGWNIYARQVGHRVPWSRGTLIFSRNS